MKSNISQKTQFPFTSQFAMTLLIEVIKRSKLEKNSPCALDLLSLEIV